MPKGVRLVDRMLIFIMALQSPGASKNWCQVSRLCERTLRSVCGQSCTNFRVFLVCNKRPAITFTHQAITIIERDFPIPEGNTKSRMQDKWLKLKFGLIAARHHAPAHVMFVDADDCVHRELAALVFQQPYAQGWRFDVGYLYPEGASWFFKWRDFDQCCGTSAIVRLEACDFPTSLDEPIDRYFILSNGHRAIGEFLRKRGTPLAPLPFIGAMYVVGTGENDSGTVLTEWGGTRFMLKKLLRARPLTQKVRSDFGLYRI
jgi:hypothetical protein